MDRFYAYSLIPVVAVSLLLTLTVAFRLRRRVGLGVFAGALAVWSGNLLLTYFPDLAPWSSRLAASGAFVAAGFLHAAYDIIGRSNRGLLAFAYATAAAVTLTGIGIPGLLFDPVTMRSGPMFWPGMALAVAGATVPLVFLVIEARRRTDRKPLILLGASGVVIYVGAWSNAYLISIGEARPWGMFLVLAGTFLLARVIWTVQPNEERRVLDSSLLYSGVATLVSAGFLLGVALVVQESTEPLTGRYGVGALFLVVMTFLALDPIRQVLQRRLGRTFAPEAAGGGELAQRLGEKEREAAQAARLAEIGTLTSAVAHEVRNPLGVLKAHLEILRRSDAPVETVAAMEEQIERAVGFVDDLLAYGRPTPLTVRRIEIVPVIRLAWSTACSAMERDEGLEIEGEEIAIDADSGQLQQAFIVLFENALLAADPAEMKVTCADVGDEVSIVVRDSGPGVPEAIAAKLFEPFVTGRKRGTGLGLAIVRGIVERHRGSIELLDSEFGASFRMRLPIHQPELSAAASRVAEAEDAQPSR